MSDIDTEKGLNGDERIIREAKRRFNYCEDYEANARTLFVEDLKFANGDSDNKYQWPDAIRATRDIAQRPCLTINKVRQHNLHIINDAKQNTPRIKIVAVGDEATFEAAEVYEGIVRRIEYNSNAASAYDTATEFQVQAGIGYWRVTTDYAGGDSFDQEIFIRPVQNPLNVYIDPDIKEKDGSDARFAFIFDDMPTEEFEEAYPKYKDKESQAALGNTDPWSDKEHVRIVEYFRCVETEDRLVVITNPMTGEPVAHRMSKMPDELRELAQQVIDSPEGKYRTIVDNKIEHFLIVGETVVEKEIWPGKYIPIVRIIGEETIIDGEMDRKGHTRALKDSQRMYNYNASAAIEYGALQSKIPYLAPAQAIEELETYWQSANTDNHAVLPYNHKDDDGDTMPAPERTSPPVSSPVYIDGMNTSAMQMDMASGQYEATFGQQSNERSGKAINARQRQGETATYHYIDNLAIGIRFTGKILIDLIPKIYDTPRVIRILAEDGTDTKVQLDPQAQQAYLEQKQQQHQQQEQRVKVIFNPSVGQYDVMADVSPGYATKREEAFNALSEIMAQNPNAALLVGDLWAENADFPTADKIAERFRNMLPPQALGQGQNPQVGALQGQLQKAQEINGKLLQTLAEERLKHQNVAAQKSIDVYKAETDRMKVGGELIDKHTITPRLRAELMHDLAMQEHSGNLDRINAAMAAELQNDSESRE